MSVDTKGQFTNLLKRSQIASEEMISLWTDPFDDSAKPKLIAQHLIENGHITNWQASQLLVNKHQLKFGNYILLERINKNELGTHFVARQLSLNRVVKLSFLSQELSRQLADNTNLVRQVAKLADFYHNHLEHLYTIEKAGLRYVLVTDYSEDSKSLNDSDVISQLSIADLQSILSQTLEAISAAHVRGLWHGAISEADLAIDNDNHIVLRNIVISFLIHSLDSHNIGQLGNAARDIESAIRIGRRLVRRLCNDDKSAAFFQTIFQELHERKIEPCDAATKIRERLRAPLTGNPTVMAADSKKVDVGSAPGVAERSPKNQTRSRTINFGVWFPPGIATLVLMTTLIVFYSSGWLETLAPIADREATTNQTTNELPADSQQIQTQASNQGQSDNVEKAAPIANSPTQELPNSTDQHSFPSTLTNQPPTTEPVTKTENLPSIDKTKLASRKIATKALEKDDDSKSFREKLISLSKASEFDDDKSSAKPTSNLVPTKLPREIELPPTTLTTPTTIGEIDATKSVTLKLVSDTNISAKKINFTLRGDSLNGWPISLKCDNSMEDVAKFFVADGSIQFEWSATAAENDVASYLSNCILRIGNAGITSYISLRKPVSIHGFVLERKKSQIKLSLPEIEHLPAEYFVQLDELAPESFGELHFKGDTANRNFSRKRYLELHFSELPEYQVLFLSLSADLSKKPRLDAVLRIQLDPQRKSRIGDAKNLELARQFLESTVTEFQKKHDYLKNTAIQNIRERFNLSADVYKHQHRLAEVKVLKSQLELAEKRFTKFRDIQTKIEPFFQDTIPISIYFLVAGQRVVLASSSID